MDITHVRRARWMVQCTFNPSNIASISIIHSIQWNPSKQDTIGTALNSEVSSFQGLIIWEL